MSRITSLELAGFKGQDRVLELGARTVLSGPNGLGKSAFLEAVRYALSGELPTGRSLDEVAKYFTVRGGSVNLQDEELAWIRRGIEVDHEKKKVSEKLEASEGSDWLASEALLDMRGFLALSANKRREFVLELVGSGETPTDQEVHAVLARDYARQIGGPGADVSILSDRLDDLPADVRALAGRWLAIWGVFTSYLRTGENTASAIFQRLVDAAKDRKNSSRRAATEAKAAIRDLKAAAKGAEAAAAEVEKRRYEAESASETFGSAREQSARRKQAQVAVEAEDRDRAKLASRVELCGIAVVEDPGERPKVDAATSEDSDKLREEAVDMQVRADEIMAQQRTLESARDCLSASRGVLEQARDEMERLVAEPIGRAVAAAERVGRLDEERWSSEFRKAIVLLLDLVEELAESWKNRREKTSVRLAECAIGVRQAEEKHAELDTLPDTQEYLANLEAEMNKIGDKTLALDNANLARIKAEAMALEEWEAKTNRATEVRTEARALKERYEAARAHHAELTEKLAAMPDPPVRALEEDVLAAREALQQAEEAAGEVKAYEEAVARAASEKLAEKSWAAVETACKHARESYVADIVRPLVDDVAAFLAAGGRQETVYLLLENDRGKPIFDLGWTLGESRRSLSALSGGEAVLFMTALALALARRSEGRRVLLIEADPLDEFNLGELLTALAGIPDDQLDACLVATSTDVGAADGWRCVQFDRDGSLQIDGMISCRVFEESELEHG